MSATITTHLASMALEGLAPAHIGARQRILRHLARTLPVPILDATPAMLLQWRARMTHTPAVVCGYVSHARCFYAWAVDEGLIPASPATKIPVPRKPRCLPRPISEQDLATALDGAPQPIRAWIILGAWCGLRCCEIARLRAKHVHLSAASPYILIAADATKGHRERAVPLCPFAAGELAAAGLPSSGWAFRRADGKRGPNEPYRVSHLISAYLHDLGIVATAHWLRHRCGTLAYAGTLDLRAVQELLGHASPVSTAGYAAITTAATMAAVASLPVPGQIIGQAA